MMTIQQALQRVEEASEELGLPLLETLEYIDAHLDDAMPDLQQAYRIVMAGFRRLFAAA